jgi:precorrin-2 dehydrogenase / sirohydrochlorin ferrochelatase
MPQKRPQSSPSFNTEYIAKESRALRPEYYPAYLDLKWKKCVVIGGGKVAERKVKALLGSGASIRVISPELTAVLQRFVLKGAIRHTARAYRKGDLREAFLVIAATSDEVTNRAVSSDAPFLVNVVDAPGLANFIVPAVITSGPLKIAVSTGGASPAMASSVRRELEILYGKDVGRYLVFIGKLRNQVMETVVDMKAREAFFKMAGSAEILRLVRDEGFRKAKAKIMDRLLQLGGAK